MNLVLPGIAVIARICPNCTLRRMLICCVAVQDRSGEDGGNQWLAGDVV